MLVGYPDDHASDTVHMWDPRSQRVRMTRDIRCLNWMYFEEPNTGQKSELIVASDSGRSTRVREKISNSKECGNTDSKNEVNGNEDNDDR